MERIDLIAAYKVANENSRDVLRKLFPEVDFEGKRKDKQRTVSSILRIADGGRDIPAACLEFDKEIDWEQRRFELVKAAMFGFNSLEDFETNAENVVGYADAVLAEYRKGEKQ